MVLNPYAPPRARLADLPDPDRLTWLESALAVLFSWTAGLFFGMWLVR